MGLALMTALQIPTVLTAKLVGVRKSPDVRVSVGVTLRRLTTSTILLDHPRQCPTLAVVSK